MSAPASPAARGRESPSGEPPGPPSVDAGSDPVPADDADADGTPDGDDLCPILPGPSVWRGCPFDIAVPPLSLTGTVHDAAGAPRFAYRNPYDVRIDLQVTNPRGAFATVDDLTLLVTGPGGELPPLPVPLLPPLSVPAG